MQIGTEILAEIALDNIGIVVANDSARASFTVASGDCLVALDRDLTVLSEWRTGPLTRGWHATSPGRGLALISGPEQVRLLDRTGEVIWRHEHAPWSGAFESGCTWFDQAGEPHAVVPAPSYDRCLVLRLDLGSGRVLAEAPIEAAPAGISPIHHPDGWVGLSEGEGQDAAKAWWVRSAAQASGAIKIEVLDGGWDNWVLSDVDHSGTKIITAPHTSGPLLVRSFPSLDVLRAIDPPAETDAWDFTPCFAGDMLVSRLIGPQERLVAIDPDGAVHDLDEPGDDWLIPAPQDTWLSAARTRIRRCRATRR